MKNNFRSHSQQTYNDARKDTGLAVTISIIITVFTLITLVVGLWIKNPFWIIAGIVPAAAYEAWRTEGYYTKIASGAIAVLVILEIFAIMGVINFNLADLFGSSETYFSGYFIPLGELTLIFPFAAVLLSLILVRRTYGPYTKWLSILLIASSAALLWVVNKDGLMEILRTSTSGYYY